MSGIEWIVDAHGCDAAALADQERLASLFRQMVADLGLTPVGDAHWHQFPGAAGITGVCLLAESHLACHTFPEFQSLCLNLFCCRAREDWDFEANLRRDFGAASVRVRRIERRYQRGAGATQPSGRAAGQAGRLATNFGGE